VKVLVANRGEIAVRIMRACRELRLPTVAVYSNSDRVAPHVRAADEAIGLGADAPGETYLRIDKLIDAARQSRAEAIHPGYGFLAENAEFAQACQDAGLCWVGPSAKVIALLGGKTAARQAAKEAGVPVVPGTESPLGDGMTDEEIADTAATVGYPLFVKAVAGGGGKGMRLVRAGSALVGAVQAARSEAASAFGDPSVYLERSVSPARHIEVQILADQHGRVVPFVERECSVQRRHQKVVEESPSIAVSPETRLALTSAAAALAEGVGYTNAGTVEFLLDSEEQFYFLEMNTRLQVEHPVTEMVTGIDLVQWQLRIAQGERLTVDADQMLEPRGHAIECRIYAEDPDAGFLPSPGHIRYLRRPAGPGIRDDSGVEEGFDIPVFYDSMISKLIAWGDNRSAAMARLERALSEYGVGGVKTTLPFFRWLLQRPEFVSGNVDTGFLDGILADGERTAFSDTPVDVEERAVLATALRAYLRAETPANGAVENAVTGWRRAARVEALG
jgi:acetyl-CoA carboxylase biotin carboxylase subunit